MAYSAFSSSEIAAGQPVKQELWQKVKDNFTDHETRISAVQTAVNTVQPIVFAIVGAYYSFGAGQTGVATIRVPYTLTLTDAKLFVVDAGSSGTLQCDVQKKSGAGSFATIFSTSPSVAFGAGSYATSTNAALSVTAVSNGDFLRLDITTVMADNDEFYLYLFHTVG